MAATPPESCVRRPTFPVLLALIALVALLALLAAVPAHAATDAGDAQSASGSTLTPTRSVATPPPRSTPRSGATSA